MLYIDQAIFTLFLMKKIFKLHFLDKLLYFYMGIWYIKRVVIYITTQNKCIYIKKINLTIKIYQSLTALIYYTV